MLSVWDSDLLIYFNYGLGGGLESFLQDTPSDSYGYSGKGHLNMSQMSQGHRK